MTLMVNKLTVPWGTQTDIIIGLPCVDFGRYLEARWAPPLDDWTPVPYSDQAPNYKYHSSSIYIQSSLMLL